MFAFSAIFLLDKNKKFPVLIYKRLCFKREERRVEQKVSQKCRLPHTMGGESIRYVALMDEGGLLRRRGASLTGTACPVSGGAAACRRGAGFDKKSAFRAESGQSVSFCTRRKVAGKCPRNVSFAFAARGAGRHDVPIGAARHAVSANPPCCVYGFCERKSVQKRRRNALFVRRTWQKDTFELEIEKGELKVTG